MNSKKIKFSEKQSNRNFQECWTNQYGVIERNSKALCILCKECCEQNMECEKTLQNKSHVAVTKK